MREEVPFYTGRRKPVSRARGRLCRERDSPHGNDGHGPETDVPQHDRTTPDGQSRPPGRRRIRDQIGRRSRLIAVVLSVSLLYVIVDIFVHGPLTKLDVKIEAWDGADGHPAAGLARPGPTTRWGSARCSSRSCWSSPGCFARRHRTWRPVVLAAMSFLVLNVVVGAMKILIGRSETETGNPDVLNGGVIFPSGHSSNMVLTGGVHHLPVPALRREPAVAADRSPCGRS